MSTQKIKVFLRCRPLNEKENGFSVEVSSEKNEVKVLDRHNSSINSSYDSKNFYFDHVFSPQAPQEDVYRTVVKPLIDQVLLGFNCTVFAYGQTGTGKTYTMEGYRSDENLSWEADPHCGMIPRAISQLFDKLRDQENKFTVRVSFLELYNEDAYDLLSPIEDSTKLRIYDDVSRKGSVIVGGLMEVVVNTKEHIFEILERGSAKRQTAATQLNACSSRSHTIFSITVNIREGSMQGEELLKVGKLNLVDLAGSENIGRSGAQDIRAREAGSINQALLTLGRVITALVEKRPHIPYRESKLTRLLQDSLGGRTKTSLIATISPAPADYEDTMNVLEYASRAKNITNNPEVNQRTLRNGQGSSEIDKLRKEIESLQERHTAEMGEIEYKVRNEVAVEFKREMERMKQSYKETCEGHLNDIIRNRDEIFTQLEDAKAEIDQKTQTIQTMEERITNLEAERQADKETHEKQMGDITKQLDAVNKQMNDVSKQMSDISKQRDDLKKQRDDLSRARDDLLIQLRHARSEIESKENALRNMEEEMADLKMPPAVEKKATKIRCKVPDEPEEGYANLTFDEDEIAVPSAKKARGKPAGKKRIINHSITLSGRKKKLDRFDEIVELSPVPARVTRSRATKRKLDF